MLQILWEGEDVTVKINSGTVEWREITDFSWLSALDFLSWETAQVAVG